MNAIQNYVWGLSKPQQHEETIIEITTTQSNQTFEWYSVTGPVQYYDWNGTRTNSKAHTFASAGVYTIKIVGNISNFRMNSLGFLVTKIIQVASTITSFFQSFAYCRSLTSIPNTLFEKNVNVTDFSYCFLYCKNLTSIPNTLFEKNVNVTDFSCCFLGCKNLTSIPNTLFEKNVNVTNFGSCFSDCTNLTSIPNGLFDKNINVTNFNGCFSGCKNLTSIPNTLFEKNVNVTNFGSCFVFCSKLTLISSTLFDKNINVNNFKGCFSGCKSLINRPKPHGLEMWQIAGTNGRPSNINIQSMFRSCTAMPDYNSLPNSVKL